MKFLDTFKAQTFWKSCFSCGKPWENHGKTMGKPWENGGLMGFNGGLMGFNGIYPLVNVNINLWKDPPCY